MYLYFNNLGAVMIIQNHIANSTGFVCKERSKFLVERKRRIGVQCLREVLNVLGIDIARNGTSKCRHEIKDNPNELHD